MKNAIYFSKIEYREARGEHTSSIILLNIPEQELSYQEFAWKKQMPSIEGLHTETWGGNICSYKTAVPAKRVKNAKTAFKSQLFKDDEFEQEVVCSQAFKLNGNQMKDLLPYCNALDFEPYRNKKMEMDDEGYICYRDEVKLHFKAITDSYIPLLELPMDYLYDEGHIWPCEKLYRYLIKTFFETKNQLETLHHRRQKLDNRIQKMPYRKV